MPVDERSGECTGIGSRYLSVAFIVWLLSRNIYLAAYYLYCRHGASVKDSEGNWLDENALALRFLSWWSRPCVRALVEAAAENPQHRSLVLAMEYLLRSAVAEYVFKENRENRSVQPHALISRYIQYWLFRGVPDFLEERVLSLTTSRGRRSDFFQKMRDEWGLRAGPVSVSRDVTEDETMTAVSTARPECVGPLTGKGDAWPQ